MDAQCARFPGVLERAALRMLGGAAAAVDRAATLAAYAQTVSRRRRSRSESLDHAQRLEALALLAAEYPETAQASFFVPPPAIDPAERMVRVGAGGARVIDLAWPSRYRPFVGHTELLERYDRHRENQVA